MTESIAACSIKGVHMPEVVSRQEMPEQPAAERAKNFGEVTLGYDEATAMAEAARCLQCKKAPCKAGCPVGVDIPEFIAEIREGNFAAAFEIISRTNALPAVCGRVCPQENQCEGKCVRGIKEKSVAVGNLERFAADWARKSNITASDQGIKPEAESKRHKVAVIGAGPAGLTCAGTLRQLGAEVTIFEALHTAGGVLAYGIPEFRLPKAIVQYETDRLTAMGCEIKTNMIIGRTLALDELLGDEFGFEAVFVGSGAGLPSFLGIDGENLIGVYSANEFLTRVNLMKGYDSGYDTPVFAGEDVVVVGGGNVAMDAARCALRLGANVTVVYRRGFDEMPARREEIRHAEEEGVIFRNFTNPVRIHGDERWRVTAVECIEMAQGEPDASGRKRPLPKPGSEFTVKASAVIIAVGTSPNPILTASCPELKTDRHGCIVVTNESGQTALQRVFAGGDAVTGAATVILAMGAGKSAAHAIWRELRGEKG
jgi:glutamate synthase (NADPH/NADH) small chain